MGEGTGKRMMHGKDILEVTLSWRFVPLFVYVLLSFPPARGGPMLEVEELFVEGDVCTNLGGFFGNDGLSVDVKEHFGRYPTAFGCALGFVGLRFRDRSPILSGRVTL